MNKEYWSSMAKRVHESLVHVERNMDGQIQNLMPHYSDRRFNEAQTVFLRGGYKVQEGGTGCRTVKNALYVYSDRIDFYKRETAQAAANESDLESGTAAWYEFYLRAARGAENLKLVHIVTGVNLGNGYPYKVYGYVIE